MAESQALRTDVRAAEKARKRENRISLAMIGVLSLFVFMLLVIANSAKETNDRIFDCTTPGGQCYDQSRQRTGEAVTNIYKSSIYMAQCSRLQPGASGPEFDRFLEQCVEEKLTRRK
jgi:hypothetical protein